MITNDVLRDAETRWSYHPLGHDLHSTDIAIGLGSHDIGVAEHAAALYHRGLFPRIIFTGANAPTTVGVFPRDEAVHFAERAAELGVPEHAIRLETQATNTGENFTSTRSLLEAHDIDVQSATLISRPYQQRRAFATAKKLWPELQVVCTSRPQGLSDYIASIGDPLKIVNMLVGDTQHIWVYANTGFAVSQPIDEETMATHERLMAAGFTKRLVQETPRRDDTD